MKTLLMHEGFVLGYGNDAEAALIMARNDLGVNDELNAEDVAERPDLTKTPDQPYFVAVTDRLVEYVARWVDTEPPMVMHGEAPLAYYDLDLEVLGAEVREEDGVHWLYIDDDPINEVFFASEGDYLPGSTFARDFEPTGVLYDGEMTYESKRK